MGEVIRVSGGIPANFLKDAMTTQTFADVALCCSGGQRFLAHRLVLSAASPYLHKVLLAHGNIAGQCELITVILAEVEGNDLAAILGFLYTGSAAVPKARLEAFSSTADALRITIPPLPLALMIPEGPEDCSKYHRHYDCHSRSQEKLPIDLTTPRVTSDHHNVGLNLKVERMGCLRQLLAPRAPQQTEFKENYNIQTSFSSPSFNIQDDGLNDPHRDCCINLKRPEAGRERINLRSHVANRVTASPWSQLVRLYHSPKIQPIVLQNIESSCPNIIHEDVPIEASSSSSSSSFAGHNLSLIHEEPMRSLNVSSVGVRRMPSPLDCDPIDRTPLNQPQEIAPLTSVSDKVHGIDNKQGFMNIVVSPKIPAMIQAPSGSKFSTDKSLEISLDPLGHEADSFCKVEKKKGSSLDTVEPLEWSDNNNNNNPPSSGDAGEELFSKDHQHLCRVCGKSFVNRTSLKIHSRTHSGEKPFRCLDCGKEFSQLRNYKYHRSVHEGTGEFAATCPECGKCFNDRGYLGSHMKIHRNRKEYVCEECGKSFNQRVAYNMHVRIHTGVKPHRCEECGKAFSRKMLLKQHLRTHSGERPYQCHICQKAFADRSNMTLHTRLHSGLKPYQCDICSKAFTKKHHLKTHLNYHTGTKPYSCPNCSLAFSQSSNMRTHYKKCLVNKPLGNSRNLRGTDGSSEGGFPTALTPPHSDLEYQTTGIVRDKIS